MGFEYNLKEKSASTDMILNLKTSTEIAAKWTLHIKDIMDMDTNFWQINIPFIVIVTGVY